MAHWDSVVRYTITRKIQYQEQGLKTCDGCLGHTSLYLFNTHIILENAFNVWENSDISRKDVSELLGLCLQWD